MEFNADPDFIDSSLFHSNFDSVVLYRGYSKSRKCKVIYKVINLNNSLHEDVKKRFSFEAEVMSAIRSPNICQVYEVKQISEDKINYSCIVMEYLESDMREEIQSRTSPYPESTIWKRLYVLVATLAHLQKVDLAHRDIKPSNILIGDEGRVKLIDFEFGRVFPEIPSESSLRGTVSYLSPSLQKGEIGTQIHHNPFKSDVFSLGMTMLHAASLNDPVNCKNRPQSIAWKEYWLQSLPYSTRLRDCLRTMLAEEEVERPDFLQLADMLKVVPNLTSPLPVLQAQANCYHCDRECRSTPFLLLPCHHIFAFCSLHCMQSFQSEAELRCKQCDYPCAYDCLRAAFGKLEAHYRR